MKSWTSPMKQVVVAVVSLSLINATVPPPAMSLPSPPLHQVGYLPPLALGGPRNSRDFATKSAAIEVKPEVGGSSTTRVGRNSILTSKHLTPSFDDKKPPVIRPTRPDSLPKTSGKRDVTSLGPHGLKFVENKGQWDERARFQLKSGGKTLWLTDGRIIFDNVRARQHPQTENPSPALPRSADHEAAETFERFVFSEDFVGGYATPTIEPTGVQPGEYNYLVGSDPTKWHTGARAFARVVYHNVWDGIDVSVAGNGANIEQEFIVHPGADLSRVE